MWIIFGIGAAITGILNIVWYIQRKNPDVFRFISLSLTALAACFAYNDNVKWIEAEDWPALMDTQPDMIKVIWTLVIVSIIINGITLINSLRK